MFSGSGTRSLDSVSRDPVPDLETQRLEVRYRIPSQPYEDCLGVWEYIVSHYTAVISGLFSQYFDEIFRSATAQSFSCCFSHLYRKVRNHCVLCILRNFFMHGQTFFHAWITCLHIAYNFIIAFSWRRAGIIDRSIATMKMWENKWGMKSQLDHSAN